MGNAKHRGQRHHPLNVWITFLLIWVLSHLVGPFGVATAPQLLQCSPLIDAFQWEGEVANNLVDILGIEVLHVSTLCNAQSYSTGFSGISSAEMALRAGQKAFARHGILCPARPKLSLVMYAKLTNCL